MIMPRELSGYLTGAAPCGLLKPGLHLFGHSLNKSSSRSILKIYLETMTRGELAEGTW